MFFQNKRILITGGTGSLGSTLLRRLLSGEGGMPERITVFSRDEAKQSALASQYSMDPKLGEEFRRRVRFRGDTGRLLQRLQFQDGSWPYQAQDGNWAPWRTPTSFRGKSRKNTQRLCKIQSK